MRQRRRRRRRMKTSRTNRDGDPAIPVNQSVTEASLKVPMTDRNGEPALPANQSVTEASLMVPMTDRNGVPALPANQSVTEASLMVPMTDRNGEPALPANQSVTEALSIPNRPLQGDIFPGFGLPGFGLPGFGLPGFGLPGFDYIRFKSDGNNNSELNCDDALNANDNTYEFIEYDESYDEHLCNWYEEICDTEYKSKFTTNCNMKKNEHISTFVGKMTRLSYTYLKNELSVDEGLPMDVCVSYCVVLAEYSNLNVLISTACAADSFLKIHKTHYIGDVNNFDIMLIPVSICYSEHSYHAVMAIYDKKEIRYYDSGKSVINKETEHRLINVVQNIDKTNKSLKVVDYSDSSNLQGDNNCCLIYSCMVAELYLFNNKCTYDLNLDIMKERTRIINYLMHYAWDDDGISDSEMILRFGYKRKSSDVLRKKNMRMNTTLEEKDLEKEKAKVRTTLKRKNNTNQKGSICSTIECNANSYNETSYKSSHCITATSPLSCATAETNTILQNDGQDKTKIKSLKKSNSDALNDIIVVSDEENTAEVELIFLPNKIYVTSKTVQELINNNFKWMDDESLNAFFDVLRMNSTLDIVALTTYYANRISGFNRNHYRGNKDSFSIALIPIHESGNHWTLGIFNKTENVIRYYDSFLNYPNNQPPRQVCNIFRSAVNDLTNGQCENAEIVCVEGNDLNIQHDGYNCGFYVCVHAEAYIMNNGQTKINNLNIVEERQRILNILKDIANDSFNYVPRLYENVVITESELSEKRSMTSTERQRKRRLKQTEEQRKEENVKTKIRVDNLRSKSYFKEIENEKNKIRVSEYRNDVNYVETENEKNKIRVSEYRNDVNYVEAENEKNRKRISECRKNSDYLTVEKKRKVTKDNMLKEKPNLLMTAHEWKNIERYRLGEFNVACSACDAYHFIGERAGNKTTFSDCCNHGDVTLKLPVYPDELKHLLKQRKSNFLNNIRAINGNFAMATLSVKQYEFKTGGPYCFRISGQIYRNFDTAAIPNDNAVPHGGQLFFIDTEDALEIRKNKLNADPKDISIIHEYLLKNNPFARSYIMMREEINRQEAIAKKNKEKRKEIKLLFNSTTGHDPRRYNLPVSNEVAAVFVPTGDGNVPHAHITVHERGKEIKVLQHIDPDVEPMLYPLFRPNGEQGWNVNIRKNNDKKDKRVSHCDYVNYNLQYRKGTKNEQYAFNALHYCGKLSQQWIVERWCCIESERLLYIRLNQNKIKATSYNGLQDWLNNTAQQTGNSIGRQIILPSSYTGGPRYMLNSYNDAMCICAEYGIPDLFITMTCDPSNPDILNNIPKGDSPNNHPALCCRVFKQHCNKLLEVLNCKDKRKGGIFGKCIAYCYTIEFQKRGLPHMHLLLTLDAEGKKYLRENIDEILSARVCLCGDENCFINKRMVHGPCGADNLNAPCMKNKVCGHCKLQPKSDRPTDCDECNNLGKFCSKGFPKDFCDTTDISKKGYATFKRPKDESVMVDNRLIDNSMIVPHSPYLVHLFGSHINVEIVNTLKSIKYIHKYIHKGYDAAMLDMVKVKEDGKLIYDEINRHLDARYVGPYEAAWHLLKYEIQGKMHHVELLPVHLEKKQTVYFNEDATNEQMANALEKNTKLTAFFEYCREHPHECFLYKDFPKTKTWANGKWKERKASFNTLGRMYTVSPSDGELFYLRILLNNVESPKSFESLYEYEGEKYDAYSKACLARNLIKGNDEYMKTIEEACVNKHPKQIRSLYVLLLVHCNPPLPEEIWQNYKVQMSEDFMYKYKNQDVAFELAYAAIVRKLLNHGKDLDLDFPSMPKIDLEKVTKQKAQMDRNKHAKLAEEMESKMNDRQRDVYEKVGYLLSNPDDNGKKCFFIYGPGGTGKTYVYKAVYHLALSMEKNVECTAFSGIAATLLPKGKTNHNMLKLPVPLTAESISRIEPNSPEGNNLKNTDIIIWDEAPMSPKFILDICDNKLKELMKNNKPFGGKIMLLGGDFRQVLPVKKNAINENEVIALSIKCSRLWKEFETVELIENKRADPNAKKFAQEILEIGNGSNNDKNDMIKLPTECIANNELHEMIFSKYIKRQNWKEMSNCAILAAKNNDVDKHNELVLNMLPGVSKTYISVDHAENWKGPPLANEVLQRFIDAGFSQPKLVLKTNAIVILLRNLNVDKGLCNGTRMRVVRLGERLLTCEIITGDKKGKIVLIPKITLIDDTNFSCELHRHQFPVKLAFAMSINKSQGQTFAKIGIDLRNDVFSHGQLYVAVSRASSWDNIKVILPKGNKNGNVKNIVWKAILE